MGKKKRKSPGKCQQVSEWNAELVQVEHRAKASAKILFYVLDKQTRNVVGIVEAAHFAGARRNLVLVIDNYEKNQLVAGESISKTEFEELSCGLATLQDLVKRQDIPVFNSIPVAIKCTSECGLSSGIDQWLACCSKVPPTNYSSQYSLDIYVGGSCFDFAWKQQVAVPILEKSGLRFRLAECGSQSSSRAGPSEAEAMDSCCVLLFVITSNTRGLETMAMLTKVAVSDYNRGRYYLVDEADRRNVPVFQNVADAVRCAVDKCFSISTACRR
ncbi:hypothetical protein AAG570_011338 [Ranatra chinensis]|uniref:Uncharacterized protein n=1 Tax=Ranatra chinensis TaxID=642074 RepID=A0ABD0YKK4_9HEMI